MKIDNFDRQLARLQDNYGLSFVSAVSVLECVEAFKGYQNLPAATLDSLQVIADLYGVSFTFHQTKRAIVLTGIWTELRASFLYHNAVAVSAFCRTATEFTLCPGANNQLSKVTQ